MQDDRIVSPRLLPMLGYWSPHGSPPLLETFLLTTPLYNHLHHPHHPSLMHLQLGHHHHHRSLHYHQLPYVQDYLLINQTVRHYHLHQSRPLHHQPRPIPVPALVLALVLVLVLVPVPVLVLVHLTFMHHLPALEYPCLQ